MKANVGNQDRREEVYVRPKLKAANEVHETGVTGKTVVRALSMLEQLKRDGRISTEQCDAGRDLVELIERGERAAWSGQRDDATPVGMQRDPLAVWTKGQRTMDAKGRRRPPPAQVMRQTKRQRQSSDGLSVYRCEAIQGRRRAMRLLDTMSRDVRAIVEYVCIYDFSPTQVAKIMRGGIDGASRRWVMRRLLDGLDDLERDLRPALKNVA